MGYESARYDVVKIASISATLSATATALRVPLREKAEIVGLSAWVTTSTAGTPVVKAIVGTTTYVTMTVIGAANAVVTACDVTSNTVAAYTPIEVTIATAGSAGVGTIFLHYKEKF